MTISINKQEWSPIYLVSGGVKKGRGRKKGGVARPVAVELIHLPDEPAGVWGRVAGGSFELIHPRRKAAGVCIEDEYEVRQGSDHPQGVGGQPARGAVREGDLVPAVPLPDHPDLGPHMQVEGGGVGLQWAVADRHRLG